MKFTNLVFLIIFFCSCTQQEQKKYQNGNYFDIKNYFEQEANRLTPLHLMVNKTVSIDGKSEERKIKISDFNKELNIFISSDINKASWRGEFKVNKRENETTYTTENIKIPVKNVRIQFDNNAVKSIRIVVKTDNILYHSTDTLNYIPDSLYQIKKTQKIKLLKKKEYNIVGRFISS